MSDERKPPVKKYTRPKPGPEDFMIYEVDGFAQLTPEQKTWPVVDIFAPRPHDPPAAPPDIAPKPPG